MVIKPAAVFTQANKAQTKPQITYTDSESVESFIHGTHTHTVIIGMYHLGLNFLSKIFEGVSYKT